MQLRNVEVFSANQVLQEWRVVCNGEEVRSPLSSGYVVLEAHERRLQIYLLRGYESLRNPNELVDQLADSFGIGDKYRLLLVLTDSPRRIEEVFDKEGIPSLVPDKRLPPENIKEEESDNDELSTEEAQITRTVPDIPLQGQIPSALNTEVPFQIGIILPCDYGTSKGPGFFEGNDSSSASASDTQRTTINRKSLPSPVSTKKTSLNVFREMRVGDISPAELAADGLGELIVREKSLRYKMSFNLVNNMFNLLTTCLLLVCKSSRRYSPRGLQADGPLDQ
jgi:hypothetical protein